MTRKSKRLVVIDGIMHRICCTCKVPKVLEAFNKELARGEQSQCKECAKAYRMKYRAEKVKPIKPYIEPAPASVLKPDPIKATLRTSKFLKYANAAD